MELGELGGLFIFLLLLFVFAPIGVLTCGYFLLSSIIKIMKKMSVPDDFFRKGLLGAVLLLIILQCLYWLYYIPTEKERIQIDTVYTYCKTLYREGQYGLAFQCLLPEYRKTHTLEEFISAYHYFSNERSWSSLADLTSHRTINLKGSTAHLIPTGGGFPETNALGFDFKKVGERWYLTGKVVGYLD